MATTRSSIVVNRPPAEVFAYVGDPRTHHEWQPQLVRTEMLTEGEVGVGTRAVEVRRMLGREIRAPFEITRHEPPTAQAFHTTGGPIRPDGLLRCDATGDATTVSYEFTFSGLLGPLFARLVGRGMPSNLARLKQRLETPPSE